MRIALVLVVLVVAVYLVVRLAQRRLGSGATPPARAVDAAAEEAYRRAVRERAERQRRGVPEPKEASEPVPSIVDIGDDVFGQDAYGRGDNETFIVVTEAPTAAVVAAMERANDRFMLVDENGREHHDGSALDPASAAYEGDLYTPNYTATPRVTSAGVEGYVDCKGGIELEMGHTLRRVLHEELARLGVPVRVDVPSRD